MKGKHLVICSIVIILIGIAICCNIQNNHTVTLANEDGIIKSEQIQPLFATVKVRGDCDTDVVFVDIETGKEYVIGYITNGISETIKLEKDKWYIVKGGGNLVLSPVNVTKGLSFQCSEETSVNSSVVSSSDSVNEFETSENVDISCEGTVFRCNGKDYEITERNKFVYSIWGYEKVGNHIVIEGSIGKNATYYGIFNIKTLEFEKDIVASKITYIKDDVSTIFYCVDNKIFDYYDYEIKGYELENSEYIYDIYLDEIGKTLFIEIADLNSDEPPRIIQIL